MIEPLSLDEAYLDVTENLQAIPVATDIANAIRARIKDVTGLNSSAGISYNKFLAKMASGHNKPNGFFVIPPAKGAAFVAGLPIEKFHGVGPATAARMHERGIFTCADLAALSLEEMTGKLGRSASYYFKLSRGEDDRAVEPNRARKSVGAEDTVANDISTIAEARQLLAPLIEKVWGVCDKRDLRGRTVTLKIKFADFEQITRSRSRPNPIADTADLMTLVEELLVLEFPPRMPIRLMGVTISSFEGGAGADGGQKSVASDILRAIGDPAPDVGTKATLWRRVYMMLDSLGVELLVIDEVQHLGSGKTVMSDDNEIRFTVAQENAVADTMKVILINGAVPIIFIGIKQARQLLIRNTQLSARVIEELSISALDWSVPEQRDEYLQFLGRLALELKKTGLLDTPSALVYSNTPAHLYVASQGRLGLVCRIVEKAVILAVRSSRRELTVNDLANAVDDVIVSRGELRTNPFRSRVQTLELSK